MHWPTSVKNVVAIIDLIVNQLLSAVNDKLLYRQFWLLMCSHLTRNKLHHETQLFAKKACLRQGSNEHKPAKILHK